MEEKIRFVTDVLKDIGQTQLSNRCGKYFSLVYDDDTDSVSVISFKGRDGYRVTALRKLSDKAVGVIYDDLYHDFGPSDSNN